MRLRDVKGKRIVGIRQTRFFNDSNGVMDIDVTALILEDGTVLRPVTIETGSAEYAHTFAVIKPVGKTKGQTTHG